MTRIITGAIGEGKTTVLMQVAIDVALSDQNWTVLWRERGSVISDEDVDRFPSGVPYLLVADDAETVAGSIVDILERKNRPNVHYLLAATADEWLRIGGTLLPWGSISGHRADQLHGLSSEDAELVVRAWEAYGDAGLKALAGIPSTALRASQLKDATERQSQVKGGAFFGGMLDVRYGEHLKDHLRSLLSRLIHRKKLEGMPFPMGFMLICAAHSADLRLTPEILAEAVGIQPQSIRSQLVDALADEAVVTLGSGFIYARHSKIAEASLELAQAAGINLGELFSSLTRAALVVGRSRQVDGYNEYARLSRKFEKTNLDVAVAVAEVVYAEAPLLLANVHTLARTYMLADRLSDCIHIYSATAVKLPEMKDPPDRASNVRRVFFQDWGHAEHLIGRPAVSVWLRAVSIADLQSERNLGFPLTEMNQDHIERALTSICYGLIELDGRVENFDMMKGAAAVIALTGRLALTESGRRVSASLHEKLVELSVPIVPIETAPNLMAEACRRAYLARERNVAGPPPGDRLKFGELFQMLRL